jgi:DNA-binding response OmpR family regulator
MVPQTNDWDWGGKNMLSSVPPICAYVIDDEQDLAWLLYEGLSRRGYNVITAHNGLEGLQRMRRQTPGVVILDIAMPVMDGFNLARRMRSDPLLTQVPILFLTARSDFPSVEQGFDLGADDYLTKPFDLSELFARLQALTRRCNLVEQQENQDRIQANGLKLTLSASTVQVRGETVHLTAAEADLLRYLILNADGPVSSQDILENVFDYPPGIGDPSLVRWHVANLRKKIELDPAHPIYIRTAAPRGYCLSGC